MLLESRNSATVTPTEALCNPLEITENNIQQDKSSMTTDTEMDTEEKNIIEKENINTGSVSLFFL